MSKSKVSLQSKEMEVFEDIIDDRFFLKQYKK